jgi:hypothetical protein
MRSAAEMLPRFSQRRVSQERVMGISFVDILIQAVFVLLVALMAGYIDPADRLKIKEWEEAGKDLCVKKLNRDSPEACREYVKDQQIGVTGPFDGIGADVCKRLGAATTAECFAAIDSKFEKGSQLPCLKAPSQNTTQSSMIWEVRSPDEIVFIGFTSQYMDYLRERADLQRLAQSQPIQEQVPKQFKLSEIESTFGFIREAGCFHDYRIRRPGRYNDADLREAISAIQSLKRILAN